MPVATGVDVGGPGRTPTVRVKSFVAQRNLTEMNPIAAYYVMVVTDHERAQRRPSPVAVVAKASLASRIVSALEYLVSLGRPANTQPI